MSTVRTPSSIEEYRRIAHAFLVGCRFPAGTKVFVVMSNVAPLYRVQGMYASEAEAHAAVTSHKPRGFTWTSIELESRTIYQCEVPELGNANKICMLDEGSMTESGNADADKAPDQATLDALSLPNVQKIQVAITVHDTVVTYTLPNDTTAIFVTQGAADAFLFSQYYAYFGPEYAVERRLRTLGARH